jgi:hypothetical protein
LARLRSDPVGAVDAGIGRTGRHQLAYAANRKLDRHAVDDLVRAGAWGWAGHHRESEHVFTARAGCQAPLVPVNLPSAPTTSVTFAPSTPIKLHARDVGQPGRRIVFRAVSASVSFFIAISSLAAGRISIFTLFNLNNCEFQLDLTDGLWVNFNGAERRLKVDCSHW